MSECVFFKWKARNTMTTSLFDLT